MSKKHKPNVAKHVAIIMDGNRRWAKNNNVDYKTSYQLGIENVHEIVQTAMDLNIPYLTIYTLSQENLKRDVDEINVLMDLIISHCNSSYGIEKLRHLGARILFLGERDGLDSDLVKIMDSVMADNIIDYKITVVVAINYSSRQEIAKTAQQIAMKVMNHDIKIEDINTNMFDSVINQYSIPEPDLLIRTGGEVRLSNFMLWQLSYTELYFCKLMWPDFHKEEFIFAIKEYELRDRKYGI